MAQDEKLSDGPNERPRNEAIAGTGPGIPDEALGLGQTLPEPPTPDEEREIAERLEAPAPRDGA